ncbi:glycoside hydrolase/deacetylase [Massarina eburnea CBS 473.64]|uniref:Glycoside hydrolase/deacetylase n=1 Tax=Massarina eburnea CBS 473.64 TaxID=1395130 RepID=A0A6A6RRP5_9PLEO|nr:glycoside hydrolase/deacetylase [Massarina eburnea CBS 473.64]
MRFSEVLAATAAVAPLVAAHGDIPGMPKIFGLGEGALKPRDFGLRARRAASSGHVHKFNKRQGGVDGRCGPEGNSAKCDDGYCCSSAGWCGNTEEYCTAPDCLIDYGTGCDANKVPNGADTRTIARPQLGSVEYGGEGIYPCQEPGTIALTYDDGPYIYTNQVLDQFATYGMKATFFITGINNGKGAIDDASTAWPAVISRMAAEGHQVASHTWSHQDLSAITQAQRIDQMVHNEMAIRNIIQKFPTYMRPPYSSCTAACQADMKALGYVVTYFDLDTDDYNNVTPDKIQNAKNNFFNAVNPSNPASDKFLVIEHDIHEQTALNLTGYMLEMVKSKGYRGVTVGECLGDPAQNWYRSSTGSVVTSVPSSPTATPTGVSQDGTCGSKVGTTCIGFSAGSCCSEYGWCGASADHCGTGCQAGFGTCGSSSGPSPTSTAPTATPTNLVTSQDGSCGGTSGYTCTGFADGTCCSQYGWCGTSTDHCGTGCNPLFGTCNVSTRSVFPSSSLSSSSSRPASSSSTSTSSSKAVIPSSTGNPSISSRAANSTVIPSSTGTPSSARSS